MMKYILALLVLLLGAPVYASVIDTQEWEAMPSNSIWVTGTQPGPAPDIDCAVPASPSGGCALRMTYPAGTYSSSTSAGGKEFFFGGSPTTLYFGSWVRYSSGFTFNPIGNKRDFYQLAGGNQTCRNISVGVTSNNMGFTPQICWVDGTGSKNYYQNIGNWSPGNHGNEWHWYEERITLNTPGVCDGIAQGWVDDVLYINYSNVCIRDVGDNTGFGSVKLSGTWGGGGGTIPTTGYRWTDHTVVSTTPIGKPAGGGAVPDTTPPTTPVSLLATASGANVSVSWGASTDNVAVTSYSVLRCFGSGCTPSTVLTTVSAPTISFIDTTIVAGSIYVYAVKAVDAAGNFSPISNTFQIIAPTTFRRTLYTDNFNRADTTVDIGAAWDAGYTSRTNLGITSNAISDISTVTSSMETFNSTGAMGDQWAQFKIASLPAVAGDFILVLTRAAVAPTESFYACLLDRNSPRTYIQRRTAGAFLNLQSTAAYDNVWVAGDRIRCEATGSAPVTIKFYRIDVNGVETLVLTDSTDSSFATGRTGARLVSFTTTSIPQLDDFAVGDFQGTVGNAVTVDTVSQSPDTRLATNTWTHTVGHGANRWLGVCLVSRGTVPGSEVVSTVTANGQALTRCSSCAGTRTSGGYTYNTDIWYQFSPSVAANTIVATWAGTPNEYSVGSALSLNGVDQTGLDAQSVSQGSGTTLSTIITTVADMATVMDCAVGQEKITVGSGQTARTNRDVGVAQLTIDSQAVSTVIGKTPAGAQNMNWSMSPTGNWILSALSLVPAQVTPVVEPTIVALIVDPANTGVNIGYGPTIPSFVRFLTFTNSGALPPITATVPISSIVAGRYNTVFPAGYDGVCAFPINATGVENNSQSAFYRCASLTGIVASVDTTPAVMTQVLPSGTLNQGTTSTTFVISADKLANMRWDTTNPVDTTSVGYDSMANAMSCASLTCSASTGNILSNGTTTHIYVRSQFTNTLSNKVTSTSSLDVPITVANVAPGDTIAPTAPTNLTFSLLSQAQVQLTWTASTDAVGVTGYQVYADQTGTCTGFVPIGNTVTLTQTVANLLPNSSVSFNLKALDAAGNMSTASSCVTVTTSVLSDVVPPSTMTNLVANPFTHSVTLLWDQMTDNLSNVTAIIEKCQGVNCTDFTVAATKISNSITIDNLTPATVYRFRGIGSDGLNLSVAYSPIVDVLTQSPCGP